MAGSNLGFVMVVLSLKFYPTWFMYVICRDNCI